MGNFRGVVYVYFAMSKVLGRPRPIPFFVLLWLAIEVSRPLSEIADVLFEIITYQKGWEYGGSSGVDALCRGGS